MRIDNEGYVLSENKTNEREARNKRRRANFIDAEKELNNRPKNNRDRKNLINVDTINNIQNKTAQPILMSNDEMDIQVNKTIESIDNHKRYIDIEIETDKEVNEIINTPASENTVFTPVENEEFIDYDDNDDIEENVDDISKLNNLYVPRDISWLTFQQRLLALANDKKIPLLERFKYLSITASNLDEFTTVRLSRLGRKQDIAINGMTMKQEIDALNDSIDQFLDKQEETLVILMEDLKQTTGYELVRKKNELTEGESDFVKKYFNSKIKSLLTPIVADNSRPFPMIMNNTINIGLTLEDPTKTNRMIFATVQVPDLERIIEIKSPEGNKKFILLEDIIKLCISKLFMNKKIDTICQYRVLRDLDYMVEDDEAFIVDTMKETLKRREMGRIMRIDISGKKKEIVKVLHKAFKLTKKDVNKSDNIIDLTFCRSISKLNFDEDLKKSLSYPKFEAPLSDDIVDEYNIFDKIDETDIILHHPYESYDSVVDFIKQASVDEDVMAIKQTLYRISDESPIMKSLIDAAENGKQVTVILEVKARFDEANNLKWAAALERAGGHVIYGIDQYKIHCKMCLIVRKDKKGNLSNYVHIGTGNYNEVNSRLYTDLSLFTSRSAICNDIEKLFNALSGFSEPRFKKILASPYNLRESLMGMIDKEIECVKNKQIGKIIIKVNGLTDKIIIDKLYEAAKAGVNITLIVRTACSIKPKYGIKIKAIIGRFLEHSRIYYFHNAQNKIYMGSSDLMERNLYNRVELMVPVDEELYEQMTDILNTYENDISSNSFEEYARVNNDDTTSAQRIFMEQSLKKNNLENINKLYISK